MPYFFCSAFVYCLSLYVMAQWLEALSCNPEDSGSSLLSDHPLDLFVLVVSVKCLSSVYDISVSELQRPPISAIVLNPLIYPVI